MFEITARNHVNTVDFDEYYLDRELAITTFNTATKCVDCACAMLINALTGEVMREYDYYKGITIY